MAKSVSPPEGETTGEEVADPTRRRRRAIPEGEDLSWEHRGSKESDKGGGTLLMAGVILGAVILSAGILFFAFRPSNDPAPVGIPQPAAPVAIVEPTKADEAPSSDSSAVPVVNNMAIVRETEPLANAFFAARAVSELLPLIRHPEITEARIRAIYPDGKIKQVGMAVFAENLDMIASGDTATVSIRTADFERKSLSFVKAGQDWKIDWESWVGWSEMPWEKFLEEKPTTPKRFRVNLQLATYYNFGFKDESKWKSFNLVSPDGERQIYGYVEPLSEADNKIQLRDAPKGRLMLLDLKFPEGTESRNQVIIDKVVAEGWLDPETEQP